jgi:hypothetical protein
MMYIFKNLILIFSPSCDQFIININFWYKFNGRAIVYHTPCLMKFTKGFIIYYIFQWHHGTWCN